jgi:hypothetical protein
LSESGCPGFEDFQDFCGDLNFVIYFLSESGCPGFEDFQDLFGDLDFVWIDFTRRYVLFVIIW